MQQNTLAFIGGGNMAGSLIGGLITDGWAAENITVADPQQTQLDVLQQRHPGLQTTTDNINALQQAEAIILAVKPQSLHEVASSLKATVQVNQPLIISIAAGIRISEIDHWLGGNLPIVRCMPNTPALVQTAATGLFASKQVSEAQRTLAEVVLRAVGITVWLDEESQLDAVTALSGSGPAYYFMVMEAMQEAGIKLGLETSVARLLTLQTALGAARLALESDEDAAALRQRVTSRGGTTEAALAVMDDAKLITIFADAMEAAKNRSCELADEFGKT